MRRLVWSADARRDLREIFEFIAKRNAPAADRLKALIVHRAEQLVEFPFIHRPGRSEETREAVIHPNYILIYCVLDDRIRLLRVLHARQQYPR